MLRHYFLGIFIFLLPISVGSDTSPATQVIPLKILTHTLNAEIANTQTTRTRGLMYRLELAEDSGMLFVFPRTNIYGMWMRNTSIPLSVAFLDEKGVILNIADMTPFTTTAHYSSKPAKYALEMNFGWFSKRHIKAGDQVDGLELTPSAVD